MNKTTTLAIDLAKQVFQLHGTDFRCKATLRQKVRRCQLPALLAQTPPCSVVMEACSSSHYWAREARSYGHKVRLIAPQHVKAFTRGQKNDRNDAEAIAVAAGQPGIPDVAVKSEEQQAILALHRIRARLVKEKLQVSNQLHGLMGEFGVTLPRKSVIGMRRAMMALIEEARVPLLLHAPLKDQLEHLSQIEKRLEDLTVGLTQMANSSSACRRLMKHDGVGPIIATAFAAEVASPAMFKNGRQVGAWLGLVPRQHSSGGKERLFGITKRGDQYLRGLLVHGARSSLRVAERRSDHLSKWVLQVSARRGRHRAVVALANKMARRLWAALRYDDYVPFTAAA